MATARSSDGDGHGLAIARSIATAHGGTLTARARPGGGMHLQVRIPADGVPAAQREPSTAEAAAPCSAADAAEVMGL